MFEEVSINMTYIKLMEYIKGRTERKPRQNWACAKDRCKNDCGFPLDEYYHCYVYIRRRIREDYVRRKKGNMKKWLIYVEDDIDLKTGEVKLDDGTLLGTVHTKNKDFSDEYCNGCRFEPDNSNDFEIFLNRPRAAKDINGLFGNVNPELTAWMCKAFDVDLGKLFESRKGWNICKNVKDALFDEKFWKDRLCPK